jgi:uncharacterized protein with von Willebrand factor type A (vWA) domain
VAVSDYEVEHLCAREHFDLARGNLSAQGLVGAKEELLAGLPAGIEGSRDLDAAERSIVEQAAVLTRERHSLGDALVLGWATSSTSACQTSAKGTISRATASARSALRSTTLAAKRTSITIC